MYYNIYRITGVVYLSMNAQDISITYNGGTYKNNANFAITSEGTSTAVPLIFENTGTESKTFYVYLGRAAGSYDNPYSLELGDFTTKVAAGNESGVYYTYTAEKDGLFVVKVLDVTSGVNYNIVAYNQTTYALRNSQEDAAEDAEGYKSVRVNVSKGDKIQVTVGTLPDSGNSYPAATFKLNAEIREGESEGTAQEKPISYSVNVTDENRKPIANVLLSMKVGTSNVTMTTNTDGYAISKQKPGTYPVILTVPNGYSARTTEFILSEKYPSISIKLDTVIMETETYTIRVLDAEGNPIVGAFVSIGTGYGETDENGVVTITTVKGTYTAVISADGYVLGEIEVSPDSKDADITLEKGEDTEKVAYTIKAVDYFGNPVPGVTLTLKQDGAVRATASTDSNGDAISQLAAGTYTVGVSSEFYTRENDNVLTAENNVITIEVIGRVSGEMGEIYDNPTDILEIGATYVNGIQSNTDNYFLFIPKMDGLYRFTGCYSNAAISYWGTNTNYLMNLTENTDYSPVTNSYTVNIKPGNLGSTYVIGLTNDTEGVIVIERLGDAILDVTDMEEIPYEAKNTIDSNFRLDLASGEKLRYIDVFGETVTYHMGSDGYYHLNSPTGPILYVNLGKSAPYLSMSNCMAVTDEHAVYKLVYVYYDDNGNPIKKETYNPCMTEYVLARCEKTDVYPLTDDLIFMFQQGDLIKGWSKFDSHDYLFYDSNNEKIPGVNEQIVWMYAVCYVE